MEEDGLSGKLLKCNAKQVQEQSFCEIAIAAIASAEVDATAAWSIQNLEMPLCDSQLTVYSRRSKTRSIIAHHHEMNISIIMQAPPSIDENRNRRDRLLGGCVKTFRRLGVSKMPFSALLFSKRGISSHTWDTPVSQHTCSQQLLLGHTRTRTKPRT